MNPQPVRGYFGRFLETVAKYPDNIAVEIQRETTVDGYSFAQLRDLAMAVGAWLRSTGIEPGARCSILADNSPRWVAAYLGVLASGNVAVPLDTAIKPAQTRKLLLDCGATVLFVDGKHLDAGLEATQGLAMKLVTLDAAASSAVAGSPTSLDVLFATSFTGAEPVSRNDDDTAVILYTSGTTSDPKGVMLTHGNLAAEANSVFQYVKIGPADAILGVLPLFHALAQMANLLLPFAAGTRVVHLETLNTNELLRALRERNITLFACVPQFFYLIHEKVMQQVNAKGKLATRIFRGLLRLNGALRVAGFNLGKLFFGPVHAYFGPRMRLMVTGGSRVDLAIARDFNRMGFTLLQAYGLTECSGCATGTPIEAHVIGSVGQAIPGVEIKIVRREQIDQMGVGEVAIRGDIVMKGYYNRADASADVLKDGWLYTGDLGSVDGQGNLFITGRLKEMIVLASGKNIYPEEVEAHYLQTPVVKEMCVVGLESDADGPASERLHAVVVPNTEVLKQRKVVNMENVIRFELETLSAQLPSAKRILSYEIWQDDLPRTTTRKLKRFEILQRVKQKRLQSAQAKRETQPLGEEEHLWRSEPEVLRALAVIARASNREVESVRAGDNLELDLTLDSMQRVELVVALEEALETEIDETALASVYTVRELVDVARASMGKASGKVRRSNWETVLATEPDDPQVQAALKPRTFITFCGFLLARFLSVFQKIFFRFEVSGLENLPKDGPYIIAPNHQSLIDPVSLVCVLRWGAFRKLFAVGTSEIFGGGVLRLLASTLKTIPVDPDANLVNAMRVASAGLRRGQILILYPEGERSIDGTPKIFRKGAAILATHLKVPIVPVAHEGYYDAWPRGLGFQKFSKLRLRFGQPIVVDARIPASDKLYEQITSELRARVVAMWEDLRTQKT